MGIPLPIKIIGYIDNIVSDLSNILNGELLQVLIRYRSSNRDGFS
jgi:hypothetical protein